MVARCTGSPSIGEIIRALKRCGGVCTWSFILKVIAEGWTQVEVHNFSARGVSGWRWY
jgi:hypothetical protein